MSQASAHVAEMTDQSGALMYLVADGLAGNGFEVGLPEVGDGRCLLIASPAARCALTVEDWGSVIWEWSPAAGNAVDPLGLAGVACALLTGRVGLSRWESDGGGRADLSVKGRVGRELQARGLRVVLEVYPGELSFEAHTEIVASAPGTGPAAEVRVTDDGWLSWERACAADEAASCPGPDRTAWIAGLGEVAGDIVAVVTLALPQSLPSGAGRP